MRRCSAVPSSYVPVADRGGAPSSGEVQFRSGFLLLLASSSSLSRLDAVWCCATNGGGERAEG